MKYSKCRHGPLTVSKGCMVQVPGREQIPGDTTSVFCEPLAALTLFSLLFEDPAVGASKPRELLADWFPCFNSYLTWQSLAPFCFQIEILYRNEKNHHTQQWINNSCQLAARAIIFTMLPDSVLIAREREFVLKLLIFKLHVKTTNCMACLSNKA